jgi:plasmid stabilization system protein ParE
MTDDIKALRDALAEVNFFKKGGFSYTVDDWNKAANPLRIARLLDALEAAQKEAERYRKWRTDYTGGKITDMLIELSDCAEPAEVDAAIDAAIAAHPPASPEVAK